MHERLSVPTGFVGTVPVEMTSLDDASERVIAAALGTRKGEPATSFRLNSGKDIALASSDVVYRELLNGPGHNLPDGTPLVWVLRSRARKAGIAIKPQGVRGPSLIREVLDRGREHGLRHYFLGSTPDVLAKMEAAIEQQYPGAIIAGSYSPPFGPVDDAFYERSVAVIAETNPDLVWVGLGAPKQDYACLGLAERTGVTCMAVGAAFDFLAGTTKEAPKWLHHTGLEWTYRLAAEPKRLWRRYLFGNAQFIKSVVTDKPPV